MTGSRQSTYNFEEAVDPVAFVDSSALSTSGSSCSVSSDPVVLVLELMVVPAPMGERVVDPLPPSVTVLLVVAVKPGEAGVT